MPCCLQRRSTFCSGLIMTSYAYCAALRPSRGDREKAGPSAEGSPAIQDCGMRCDEKSKAKYLALKARGCSHARALRTIGDRLLYVACTMLKNGTLFDPCFESQKSA